MVRVRARGEDIRQYILENIEKHPQSIATNTATPLIANASPLGVPSTGLLKTAGYVVLVFAALGVYLFYDAAQAGTGGKRVPLGNPLVK